MIERDAADECPLWALAPARRVCHDGYTIYKWEGVGGHNAADNVTGEV